MLPVLFQGAESEATEVREAEPLVIEKKKSLHPAMGARQRLKLGDWVGFPLHYILLLCGFTPYLLSPSLGNNVKMNRIKVPGPDKKNNNTHHPDFDESCKRRTRIVIFGMI